MVAQAKSVSSSPSTIMSFTEAPEGGSPVLSTVVESGGLSTIIFGSLNKQSDVHTQALSMLSNLEAAPSCVRDATKELLSSCHDLTANAQAIISSFDEVKSGYGAKLAVCELQAAGSSIPGSCSTTSLIGRMMGKGKLAKCLRDLESRPQWWTSYSNNRQNAAVLCQAARAEIERGMCSL